MEYDRTSCNKIEKEDESEERKGSLELGDKAMVGHGVCLMK